MNRAFLRHVEALGPERALARQVIRRAWLETYRDTSPESFVPDALAVLYPSYRAALEAFDAERPAQVEQLLAPLRRHRDPYLSANASYFHARALLDQGRLEQAETVLAELIAAGGEFAFYTPYAPHVVFMQGYCQASNLRFEAAIATLTALGERFPDAPEPVRVGARQLLLEIQRRQTGTLDEVALLMDYLAVRLRVCDTTTLVRGRQQQVVALLDKLILEAEQREQAAGGSARAGGRRAGRPRPPQRPAEDSQAPPGSGRIGRQHAAPRADPGEAWGKLPPAEREKILQSLRGRFPARYRQLVEQYFRSLAEEKE